MKDLGKREQSNTRIDSAECENLRAGLKDLGKREQSESRVILVLTLPSVKIFEQGSIILQR